MHIRASDVVLDGRKILTGPVKVSVFLPEYPLLGEYLSVHRQVGDGSVTVAIHASRRLPCPAGGCDRELWREYWPDTRRHVWHHSYAAQPDGEQVLVLDHDPAVRMWALYGEDLREHYHHTVLSPLISFVIRCHEYAGDGGVNGRVVTIR